MNALYVVNPRSRPFMAVLMTTCHNRGCMQDARMATFQYRIHHFKHKDYDIWGLTGGMLIKVAEMAFARSAEFDVHGKAIDYSQLYFDGNQVCVRECDGNGDVCFLDDGKAERRTRSQTRKAQMALQQ